MSNEATQRETGTISINTENIFPIIKKWLYSDKEIFLRELVSNGIDAIHKLQHINVVEQLKLLEDYAIDITVDKEKGTLTVKDNGIGMTADEVRRYINQVAFSSAEEFVKKFKEVEDKNQIIGHFGLGFYSSFMVARKVEIRTLSYLDGATGVHWSCDGSTAYELEEIERKERGTEVILTLSDDEQEFLDPLHIREILKKYCNFLPYPIRLGGDQINDRNPLWTKPASEVSEEDYKNFYRKLYPFAEEPLFWIHLNIDFPFNLKGIVYFPKLNTEFDVSKCSIKLFCNQVFVSDNCPELIPEFLTPLQGCLDAPDLPLNVSRSYLQNEPQVRKIREVLAGRVAGKINDLAKGEGEAFAAVWEDIHPFVKYGMMRDDKFYEKVKDRIVFRVAGAKNYTTLPDYLQRAETTHAKKVYYANDEAAQSTYLKLFQKQGMEVLVMDALIDSHFIQFLEMKNPEVTFKRVDSELTENLIEAGPEKKIITGPDQKSDDERIEAIFRDNLKEKDHKVQVQTLKDDSVPAMILLPEESRRFQELTRIMGKKGLDLFKESTFLVNLANSLVKNLLKIEAAGKKEEAELLVDQIYDLACLAHKSFDKERMEAFLERSNRVLELLSRKVTE
ncbi:MAG: molecular chaperone HtpG [Desulfuromonadaceae bacterium]|nr:molecular chaperone HtpG [Desulfuromonadaceae bacterium]